MLSSLEPIAVSYPCWLIVRSAHLETRTGLGLALSHQLAALSPGRLILAVRSLAGGTAALESILKTRPGTTIDVWELDLSSAKSIKAFARRAEKDLGKIDVLFNNAGYV